MENNSLIPPFIMCGPQIVLLKEIIFLTPKVCVGGMVLLPPKSVFTQLLAGLGKLEKHKQR